MFKVHLNCIMIVGLAGASTGCGINDLTRKGPPAPVDRVEKEVARTTVDLRFHADDGNGRPLQLTDVRWGEFPLEFEKRLSNGFRFGFTTIQTDVSAGMGSLYFNQKSLCPINIQMYWYKSRDKETGRTSPQLEVEINAFSAKEHNYVRTVFKSETPIDETFEACGVEFAVDFRMVQSEPQQ